MDMVIAVPAIITALGPSLIIKGVESLVQPVANWVKYGKKDGLSTVLANGITLATLRSTFEDPRNNDSQTSCEDWGRNVADQVIKPLVKALVNNDTWQMVLGYDETDKDDPLTTLLTTTQALQTDKIRELGIWKEEFEYQLRPSLVWGIHQTGLDRRASKIKDVDKWLSQKEVVEHLKSMAKPKGLRPVDRRRAWMTILQRSEDLLEDYFQRCEVDYGIRQALTPPGLEPDQAMLNIDIWVEKSRPRQNRTLNGQDSGNDFQEYALDEVSERFHRSSPTVPWSELAESSESIVLLGSPGNGKTWLFSQLALRRTRTFLDNLNTYKCVDRMKFPMFTRVDQLLRPEHPSTLIQHVLMTLQKRCNSSLSGHFDDQTLNAIWSDLEAHMETRGGIELFLDALDESPEGLGIILSDKKLNQRVLLSSRYAGYRQPEGVNSTTWQIATIKPLNPNNIMKLAASWKVPPTAMTAIEDAISRGTPLGKLLSIPLLASMACAVALDKGTWPSSMDQLFREYIEYRVSAAFHWWNTSSGDPQGKPYDYTQTLAILGDIATHFSGHGNDRWRDAMPVAEVRRLIAQHLEQGETTDMALSRLQQSGLLVGGESTQSAQEYYFQHRTIAEYMVAQYAIVNDDWKQYLSPSFWFHRDWDRVLHFIGELCDPVVFASALEAEETDTLGRATELAVHSYISHGQPLNSSSEWVWRHWRTILKDFDRYGLVTRLDELVNIPGKRFWDEVGSWNDADSLWSQSLLAVLTKRYDDPHVVDTLIELLN